MSNKEEQDNDIFVVAAINKDNFVVGIYAVDPITKNLPDIDYEYLVDYPTQPVFYGEYYENENFEESPIPILGWPEPGWRHINENWLGPIIEENT